MSTADTSFGDRIQDTDVGEILTENAGILSVASVLFWVLLAFVFESFFGWIEMAGLVGAFSIVWSFIIVFLWAYLTGLKMILKIVEI